MSKLNIVIIIVIIHYFPGKQGLAINLLWPTLQSKQHMYSPRQVSGTVNWRGTILITFNMDVTCVIFDCNSVV